VDLKSLGIRTGSRDSILDQLLDIYHIERWLPQTADFILRSYDVSPALDIQYAMNEEFA
jgi:hypothetical protein